MPINQLSDQQLQGLMSHYQIGGGKGVNFGQVSQGSPNLANMVQSMNAPQGQQQEPPQPDQQKPQQGMMPTKGAAGPFQNVPGSQMNGAFIPLLTGFDQGPVTAGQLYPDNKSWANTSKGPMFKSDINKQLAQIYWANVTNQGQGLWGNAVDQYNSTLDLLGIQGTYEGFMSQGKGPMDAPYQGMDAPYQRPSRPSGGGPDQAEAARVLQTMSQGGAQGGQYAAINQATQGGGAAPGAGSQYDAINQAVASEQSNGSGSGGSDEGDGEDGSGTGFGSSGVFGGSGGQGFGGGAGTASSGGGGFGGGAGAF